MFLIFGLAKSVVLIGVVVRPSRDVVVLQRLEHVAGLLRDDHGIQLTLKENHRHADLAGMQ